MKDTKAESVIILADRHREQWVNPVIALPVKPHSSALVFENRLSLTVTEVAFALGLSQKSVERLIKRGEIKSKRVGRRVLISRSDIEAWLNQKE